MLGTPTALVLINKTMKEGNMTKEQHIKLSILIAESVGMMSKETAVEMIETFNLVDVFVPLELINVEETPEDSRTAKNTLKG